MWKSVPFSLALFYVSSFVSLSFCSFISSRTLEASGREAFWRNVLWSVVISVSLLSLFECKNGYFFYFLSFCRWGFIPVSLLSSFLASLPFSSFIAGLTSTCLHYFSLLCLSPLLCEAGRSGSCFSFHSTCVTEAVTVSLDLYFLSFFPFFFPLLFVCVFLFPSLFAYSRLQRKIINCALACLLCLPHCTSFFLSGHVFLVPLIFFLNHFTVNPL